MADERHTCWCRNQILLPVYLNNKLKLFSSDKRPSAALSNSFTYTGNFVFYGLRPQTEYEVIIQSRNREGWSDPNDIYKFTTRSRKVSFVVNGVG